jgi:hypothetical protein
MAQPRILGDRKLAAAAERALGKLMASLPVPLRARAESMRQRLYIDTTGWFGGTEDLSMLPIVQEAVARDSKLKIRYSNRRSRFEPVSLADPGAPHRSVSSIHSVWWRRGARGTWSRTPGVAFAPFACLEFRTLCCWMSHASDRRTSTSNLTGGPQPRIS